MIAPTPALEEWKTFWHEGESFAKLCTSRAKTFTNEIRYNLAGMAVEKLVMGALMRRGTLPEGHTLRDLMDAVESAGLIAGPLCEHIRHMDDFQQICAFDTYTRTVPNDEEMAGIEGLVAELKASLLETL
jgi:hypothetical protein